MHKLDTNKYKSLHFKVYCKNHYTLISNGTTTKTFLYLWRDADYYFKSTGEITPLIWNYAELWVAKMWPSLPFCFHEHHFSSEDMVITLHVVLCGALYIRFCSLRAFGNIIMCSHYCRHHKTQAGNELVSSFPLAWHIVLVIELKMWKTSQIYKARHEVNLLIKIRCQETNDVLLIDGIKCKTSSRFLVSNTGLGFSVSANI